MASTRWDELVDTLPPPVVEEPPASDPLHHYEQYLHSVRALIDALESKPPGETVLAMLEQGVEHLMAVTDAADATLFVLDEHSRELSFVVVRGTVPADKLKWRKLARGYGIAGWVAENATHVVANDIEYDSRFCSWFDDELAYKTKTVLAVPILHDDRVLGVMELLNKAGRGLFTNVDLSLTTVYANVIGQVLNDLTSRGEKTTG